MKVGWQYHSHAPAFFIFWKASGFSGGNSALLNVKIFVTLTMTPTLGLPNYIPSHWCFLEAVPLPSVSTELVYGVLRRDLGRQGLVSSGYSPGSKCCVAWQQQLPVRWEDAFLGQPPLMDNRGWSLLRSLGYPCISEHSSSLCLMHILHASAHLDLLPSHFSRSSLNTCPLFSFLFPRQSKFGKKTCVIELYLKGSRPNLVSSQIWSMWRKQSARVSNIYLNMLHRKIISITNLRSYCPSCMSKA